MEAVVVLRTLCFLIIRPRRPFLLPALRRSCRVPRSLGLLRRPLSCLPAQDRRMGAVILLHHRHHRR
jgi:hypothetical protein